ncbi:hypothetical protein ARMSODRAFT_1018301 [Armillaria solidipes]|uniref:Uncharacterized protein n=1 Tax=Armillaria solidipes TaxID=1076256 RepID=A0A2H3BH79_9AGAR|nr:hypothetical protein ARMSODRAFT_1018301 [Armillaria solidipes]
MDLASFVAVPIKQDSCYTCLKWVASYLEGPTKDWWVYQRADLWATADWDNGPARFRLPNFEEFIGLLTAQFRDPAVTPVACLSM